MKSSLGQLANAPLALVLAQVVFSDYHTIGDRIPAIQEILRKQYPASHQGIIQTLEISASGIKTTPLDRWQFSDARNREGFFIQRNSLTFLATAYEKYDTFSDRFARVLEVFEQCVPDAFVERLGLRYVDVIVPVQEEVPEDFVVEGLRGLNLDSLHPKRAVFEHVTQLTLKEGTFVLRYLRDISEPFLPDDLKPWTLDPPDVIARAREQAKAGRSIAILDFDRVVPDLRVPFSAKDLQGRFEAMHQDHSVAFKSAQSKYGRTVWEKRA